MSKINKNGKRVVKCSFDITKQGHNLGEPRNYNIEEVTALINNSDTQNNVRNGYAQGFYGHQKRNTNTSYFASEHDSNGNEVMPVCRTTSLSINKNIITHTQRIMDGEKGDAIIDMINSKIGGFSFVWNLGKKLFLGADYVLVPNFNGNRVIIDSICTDGKCAIDTTFESLAINEVFKQTQKKDNHLIKITSDLMKASGDTNLDDVKQILGKFKNQELRIQELENSNKILTDDILQFANIKSDFENQTLEMDKINRTTIKIKEALKEAGLDMVINFDNATVNINDTLSQTLFKPIPKQEEIKIPKKSNQSPSFDFGAYN